MLSQSQLELAWQAMYSKRASIQASSMDVEDRAKCDELTLTMAAFTGHTLQRRNRIEAIQKILARFTISESDQLDDLRTELRRLERAESSP